MINSREEILQLISPEKTDAEANEKKSGASTAQGLWRLWQHKGKQTMRECIFLQRETH